MPDLFISYSRDDAAFVARLQEALEARGKSAWVDVEGIHAGEVFPQVLRTAIEQSDAFVFVLSPGSLTSTYCADEIGHAEGLEKRILPLLVRPPGDVPVLAAVRDRHWIMFDEGSDFERATDELVQALDTDQSHVRGHTRLLVRALEWDTAHRDRSRLLRGADLDAAEAWLSNADSDSKEPPPTELHRRFIADSRAAATRRTRVLAAASTTVAVVAVALLVVALVSRREAVEERSNAQAVALTATAGRLGTQAQIDDQLDHATLLARQAVELEDSVSTRGDLLGVLTRAPAAIGTLKGAGNKHQTMAMRPDGRLLVLGGAGKVVGLDPTNRDAPPIVGAAEEQHAPVATMRFTRDGRLLAAGLGDGTVLLFDGASLALRETFTDLRPHGILGLDFSSDGSRLAASCGCEDFARSAVWDVASHTIVVSRAIPGASAGIFFASGNEVLLPQARGTLVLDASTLEETRMMDASAVNAALSPDGKTLAATGGDGTLEFVDVATGAKHVGVGRHTAPIYSLTFSLDSSQIVTTSADHSVINWNVVDGSVRNTLVGFAGCDCGAALSNDGTTVYTNGINGDVVVWDLVGDRRFVRPFAVDVGRPENQVAATSPTGTEFARLAESGEIVVFDAVARRTVSRIPPGERGAIALAFSPDGSQLAVSADDGAVRTYRTADASPVGEGTNGGGPVYNLAFSRNGSVLFGLREDGALVQLEEGKATSVVVDSASGVSLAVNPRADEIALAREDGQVQLLTTSGESRRTFRADPEFVGMTAYSPDGRYLVTAGALGARLWTSNGDPIGGVLPGELDAIFEVAFSPDAKLVATMASGGVVRLYDVATGKELGSGVTASAGMAGGVAFTSDGRFLVAHYPEGDGFTMPASIDAWKSRACEIAGRTLTRDEWSIDVPGRPYAPACR